MTNERQHNALAITPLTPRQRLEATRERAAASLRITPDAIQIAARRLAEIVRTVTQLCKQQ